MFYSRNFKKITDLRKVKFEQTEGLLIADRTGEIGFINIENVQHLPEKIDDDYVCNMVEKQCKYGVGSFQEKKPKEEKKMNEQMQKELEHTTARLAKTQASNGQKEG